ncbi:MAG: NAD(P)-dependent oxidoreductase [Anaerolineae bacterium]|nr:NAD(P)-dependent oxidoreductase [Anaerolineae bacterium]
MTKVVVTGGSGKAGRAAIRELLEHDYDVINVDVMRPAENLVPFYQVDLTDYGMTVAVLHGADVVVHMAANPAPDNNPLEGAERFYGNTMSTYHIFNAACKLGIQRVVWASSETTLGLPFDDPQPEFVPIDESHTLYPNSSYALSKVVSEEMARQFYRWSGTSFVGLRFSNIMSGREAYERFPSFWDDAHKRKGNLWGYIDDRDVAQACRKGIEADVVGAEAVIIAAGDTVMNRPSRDLMAEVYPGVPVRTLTHPFGTLLSNEGAKRAIGYEPQHSWREFLSI